MMEVKKLEMVFGWVMVFAQVFGAVFILYSVSCMMVLYEGVNGFDWFMVGGVLALAMIGVQALKVLNETVARVKGK